jgi:hypothetical protein
MPVKYLYDIILRIKKNDEDAFCVCTVDNDYEKANALMHRLQDILQESSETLYKASIKEHVVEYNEKGDVVSHVCSYL